MQKNTQKEILNRYLQLSNNPTLKEMSYETGIQITRMFRILNGSTMKLAEYEIIKELIEKKSGFTRSLCTLADECLKKLSLDAIQDVELYLQRKLNLWNLKQITNIKQDSVLIA